MIGFGLESPAPVLLSTALGILALALFLLASWLGRWSLWVVGWICAILAVTMALALQLRPTPTADPGLPAQTVALERSAWLPRGGGRPVVIERHLRAPPGVGASAADAVVTKADAVVTKND